MGVAFQPGYAQHIIGPPINQWERVADILLYVLYDVCCMCMTFASHEHLLYVMCVSCCELCWVCFCGLCVGYYICALFCESSIVHLCGLCMHMSVVCFVCYTVRENGETTCVCIMASRSL